jgi:hypothetical protein
MDSILFSTKKILGMESDYTAFDLDILTHINAAFSTLNQLGVGPEDGFFVEDSTITWDDFVVPANQLNLVKTYIYLKVRFLFDPPTTSFLLDAMANQVKEYEWRLNIFREVLVPVFVPPEEEEEP